VVSLRRLWLTVHRWVALGVGWVLALVALLGAVLVVAQPLDRAAHPELFRAAPLGQPSAVDASPASLESIQQRLANEFGAAASFTFRPPREHDDTLWVLVRGPWSGTVYLQPETGREQGRRAETEGFVNIVFKLHSSLMLQDIGKAMLAWIALSYLFLLVTGLVLWWLRRWPPVLRIEWRKGALRALFDLHRTGGALLGLVITVSVASGAYMAWRPLGDLVSALAGSTPLKAPALSKRAKDVADSRPMPLDEIVARARSRFPGAPVGYVQVPARPDRPIRVRLRLADDPHPNGLTSVWMDPRNGEVLAVHRWNELDTGAKAVAYVYPLHIGELGGPAQQVLIFISGITLAGLGGSGLWLWWRRR
jgi:uncharacterized iron-regulated membrane protein